MKTLSIAAALIGAVAATPAFACASCGCTLTSDWLSQGLVAQPGTTAGLRYDYVPQTQLRTEHRTVSDAEQALPADREIERYTENHYVTATLDRQFDSDWGVDVAVPFTSRPHGTVAEGDTGESFSRTEGLGDVRITARWQGLKTKGCVTGLQVGFIVPTGAFHQTFRAGPAKGEFVDRGLQSGTGVFQATLGYYMFGKLTKTLDYILQAQGQLPLDSRDLYKPGAVGQVSAGLHYTQWRGITPQLEIGFHASAKDSGLNSDRANSGGEQVYVSPGLVASLGRRVSAFGYVQLPLYQRVNGYQLAPRYTLSTGLQLRL
ncbi:MAG: hypothetical protein ABIS14_10210 [Sphingomonas sp.]